VTTGDASDRIGLVFVSHSVGIADGLVDLARQMAPTASLEAAGGTDDGRVGTSFEKVSAAIAAADGGAGVVVLCDLGSAILTTETALDFLDDEVRERVRIADAPLVEGGVAAAVAAETGGDLDAVAAAAHAAWGRDSQPAGDESADWSGGGNAAPDDDEDAYTRSVVLANADGLHARPAAELVKLASTFNAHVTVNGKDAKSLLGIMSLGLTKGMTAEISSSDGQARDAVDALVALIESRFGEE
jgi:phosphoenolpyruvate---glycerone phosphotransferase subunit DhaM